MKLSKKYLESVSTGELLKIAKIYGLFVPNDLDRRFIIEELLDLSENDEKQKKNAVEPLFCLLEEKEKTEENFDENPAKKSKKMKISYTSTEIHLLLRDPMWLFSFWDFSKTDLKTLTTDINFDTLLLRVFLYKEENKEDPYDYYDIEITPSDRSRYIYLSFEDVLTRVAVCVRYIDGSINLLLQSNCIYLRRSNIPKKLCAINNNTFNIEHFSGISILKKSHFKNYRQAFRKNRETYFEK